MLKVKGLLASRVFGFSKILSLQKLCRQANLSKSTSPMRIGQVVTFNENELDFFGMGEARRSQHCQRGWHHQLKGLRGF
jgi:hypothetical protein|uniref:Uncharacterized protein n=1 Tax=uncultured planctomycete 5H12 TaxID=455067 RepID=A9LGP6_9BACT|nr:hypothetical protein 5H12_5 [uncultured planctomycete 5H12]